MKLSRFVFAAMFASGCAATTAPRPVPPGDTPAETAQKAGAIRTSTDPAMNPDAAAMTDFKMRVEKYAALHKGLATGAATQKENTNATQLDAQKRAIVAKIQAARANAQHGDIFAPEIRLAFRRLLAPELKGADGRDSKAALKDEAPAPGTVHFKVNAKYPEDQPKATMPANLLLNLPSLPEPLEYRVVGQHLLLLDTSADLIVDYILNAIIT